MNTLGFNDLPEDVELEDGTVMTRDAFHLAMLRHGDEEGYSYDEFSVAMTWISMINNKPLKNGELPRNFYPTLFKLTTSKPAL